MQYTEYSSQNVTELTKGKQIRHIRKTMGLTQSEFSVLLGVSKNAESDWENDKYEPNADHWKIIKALPDVRVDGNEELQLAFLKVLPLCPACRKVSEDHICNFYKVLKEKVLSRIYK